LNKKYNFAAAARKIERNQSYFSVMKCNKDSYEFFKKFGDSPLVAHENYMYEQLKLRDRLLEISNELTKNRSRIDFGKFLVKNGEYKHPNSFAATVDALAFTGKSLLGKTKFEKYRRIIKLYKEYKKEKKCNY